VFSFFRFAADEPNAGSTIASDARLTCPLSESLFSIRQARL